VVTSVGCIVGLCAAFMSKRLIAGRHWPTKALTLLAVVVLLIGAQRAGTALVTKTTADAAIMAFYAVGFTAFLKMIAAGLRPEQSSRWFLETGFLGLFILGLWSWASAVSMYGHRGATGDTAASCILVPEGLDYDIALTSIWDMRLPAFASHRAHLGKPIILNYHAILVGPDDTTPVVYNWSKTRMRFEVRDQDRNPYLPTECPAAG